LQRLPRRALGLRLGERAHDVMLLLDGVDDAPLYAWRPPEVPEERVELDWGAASVEGLAFVVKALCDRLAARLEGRAMSAARLELCLRLDRALCHGFSHVSTLEVVLPSPIARATDLCAVLRARLEHLALPAPVLGVTLRVPELARKPARNLDLLSPEPRADRALPRLVAEIGAELGDSCIGTLALVDTWLPEERTCLVPFGGAHQVPAHPWLVTTALEPSRIVSPVLIERDELVNPRPLLRVQSVQWWRRGGGASERRDLVAAWITSSHASGHAWVELRAAPARPAGPGEAALFRGWFD
jgi:protein ImuB